MTSDSDAPYAAATLAAYGEAVTPPPTGKPVRPRAPDPAPRAELTDATAAKRRDRGSGSGIPIGGAAGDPVCLPDPRVSRLASSRS